MFPPSLYEYVTKEMHKDMILVLNKIDLAPPDLVVAWKHYFINKYPKLHLVMFTTTPGYNLRNNVNNASGKFIISIFYIPMLQIAFLISKCFLPGLQIRRRKGRLRMATEGTQLLLDACKNIVGKDVDLSSWQEKINVEKDIEYNEDDNVEIGEVINSDKPDTTFYRHEKYKNGILTIGCLGQPNVGKSSLMNAIMGKKVVSVSKTPGHTKHFQTIFLTRNVKLCDCPGLVFPSKVPKALQVSWKKITG